MCLYPRIIKNRKYTATKKNGGVIPALNDLRVQWVPVGCQKCMECRKQKAREWQIRLGEEVRGNNDGKFITLTFSDISIKRLRRAIKGLSGYELDNEIATLAVRRFLGRYRKKYKKSIRHWLVTELGHVGTENIHLHGILFTKTPLTEIQKIWKYGYVWIGNERMDGTLENYVSERTVNYITKYINKMDEDHKEYKSKVLTSPGIGRGYFDRTDFEINKYKGKDTLQYYRARTGHKMALPIYYRNKIYSEDERESLWITMLDKQERWVCGERVDISKGDKDYFKLLKHHRARNKRLGYGDDAINWERKAYENQRRELLMSKRIERASEIIEPKGQQQYQAIAWGGLGER